MNADPESPLPADSVELKSSDGQYLGLGISGYEFPDEPAPPNGDEDPDGDWLNVQYVVVHPQGTWSGVAPVLMTAEAEELADWLGSLSSAEAVRPELSFTEPNLRFSVHPAHPSPRLRVWLSLESSPPWVERYSDQDRKTYVEFSLAELDLVDASKRLRRQLKLYPIRHPYLG